MTFNTSDQLDVFVLNVGYAVQDADWNWKNVCSPFARLYYVAEGAASLEMTQKDGSVRIVGLRPGHLYLIPPHCVHGYVCDSHFAHYYVHIYENPNVDCPFMESMELPVEVEAADVDRSLFERLCRLLPTMRLPDPDPETYNDPGSLLRSVAQGKNVPFAEKMEVDGIVHVLLSRFFMHAKAAAGMSDDRIRRSIGFIRRNIVKELAVSELAGMELMSKDHYIRLFRSKMGITPMAYIIRLKMERAELLLLTTCSPVKQIAQEMGYEDTSYFVRIFRKYVGKTPQQYRDESA